MDPQHASGSLVHGIYLFIIVVESGGVTVWSRGLCSQLGKTPIRTNILSFGLCGSFYSSDQHCWRVGWGDSGERWPLFTAGQEADQDQHSILRPLWFMLFICSALFGESGGLRWGAVA
jgi:hypothetical protein